MPSFRNLPPEQLAALVDYVKYLSIRGEAERLLLSQASKLDQDEELLDLSMADDEATLEDFEDAMADAIDGDEGCLSRVLPKWIKRDATRFKTFSRSSKLRPESCRSQNAC